MEAILIDRRSFLRAARNGTAVLLGGNPDSTAGKFIQCPAHARGA